MAAAIIEPWGEERADWRIGQLCCLVYNAMRGKEQKPAKLKDFLWSVEEPENALVDAKAAAAEAKRWVLSMGGEVK